ncbi:hypothetical protein DASC09_026560 [Saccharomycopsis crataegensis]|uniref:Uncharacterized protein n=1 Tax=Saccharomycopsis crataegensis TaxID=43959 RepID=A0AAV5QKZ5_9ASCO|nr:hypothetical protein DASC09_026560 [Saccharomycopsis crataegensis]
MSALIHYCHSDSLSSNESFYSLESAFDEPSPLTKPRTTNFGTSPRFYNSVSRNSSRVFGASPFTMNHHNKSTTSVATSIFERDVESPSSSIYTMSNASLNSIPMHHKQDDLVAPALNASVEALSCDKSGFKNIDVISSSNTRTADLLANCFAKNPITRANSMFTNSPRRNFTSSPHRIHSVSSKRTNVSVEDLVRDRKNSVVSFCSYNDYLESESKEAGQPIESNNLFSIDLDLSPRNASISKILCKNSSTANISCAGLAAPPSVVGKRSTASVKTSSSPLYKNSNTSNISMLEELKFKSLMTRKMSNLDNTLAFSYSEEKEFDVSPKMTMTPTASPVALSKAYEPSSAVSSPLEDDELEFNAHDEFEEFETVLESAFSYKTVNQQPLSSLNVCSLDDTIRETQKELSFRH